MEATGSSDRVAQNLSAPAPGQPPNPDEAIDNIPPPTYNEFVQEAYPNGYPYHKLSHYVTPQIPVHGSVNIEMTPFLTRSGQMEVCLEGCFRGCNLIKN